MRKVIQAVSQLNDLPPREDKDGLRAARTTKRMWAAKF